MQVYSQIWIVLSFFVVAWSVYGMFFRHVLDKWWKHWERVYWILFVIWSIGVIFVGC